MPRFVLVVSRVLLVGTLAAITYLSLTPSPPAPPTGWDKVFHLLAYGALAFLMALSVRSTRLGLTRVLGFVLAIVGYGIIIEFIQHISGRELDVLDMAMNAIGAVAGVSVGAVVKRFGGDRE